MKRGGGARAVLEVTARRPNCGVRRGAPREIQGPPGIRLRREPPAHALRESREGRPPLSLPFKEIFLFLSPLPLLGPVPMSDPILTHRVDGEGPPLVLLNGGMMSLSAWEPIARRLAERHRVIRCDFRGQLLSPGAARASMEEHADDVAALLDALGRDARRRRRGVVRGVRRAPPRGAASPRGSRPSSRRPSRTWRTRGWASRATVSQPPSAPSHAAASVWRSTTRSCISPTRPSGRPRTRDEIAARRAQVPLLPGLVVPGPGGSPGERSRRSTWPRPADDRLPGPRPRRGARRRHAVRADEGRRGRDSGRDFVVVPGSGHALVVEREDEFILLAERFLARVGRARAGA